MLQVIAGFIKKYSINPTIFLSENTGYTIHSPGGMHGENLL